MYSVSTEFCKKGKRIKEKGRGVLRVCRKTSLGGHSEEPAAGGQRRIPLFFGFSHKAAYAAHTEDFFAQTLSGYFSLNCRAVSASALASPLALYFATPAQ